MRPPTPTNQFTHHRSAMHVARGCRFALAAAAAALLFACAAAEDATRSVSATQADGGDLRQQLRTLDRQVSALLERRREDLQSIEEHMRRKLIKSQELVDVREEIRSLRLDIEQLRTGHKLHHPASRPSTSEHHGNQEKNDHLTLKWLANAMQEVRTEMNEIQTTINSTGILGQREQLDGQLALLKTDVGDINRELELSRSQNAKYEAEMQELRDELAAYKEHSKAAAVVCAKTKNQLKATQMEWNYNWKKLQQSRPITGGVESRNRRHSDVQEVQSHSRHQRVLKMHIIELEKTSRGLQMKNDHLEKRVEKLATQLAELQQQDASNEVRQEAGDVVYDRISGNEVENYLKQRKINEIKTDSGGGVGGVQMLDVERQQSINTKAITNLTEQFTNFDKLHSSVLELLENVESIEDRVDKMLPEFRKEISKLEFQTADGSSKLAALKEDQANIRASVKAISVSVSNLQDKTDGEAKQLKGMLDDVENLKISTSVQTSKLHDHILKSESSTADANATKSTVHLVQELKSFEKEYKSIVNKLPHDCNAVAGPDGVYLISPGDGEPILAFCSAGWTTIQKRYDGSVNFNRNWNDYSNGFGSATGEHWLGNRNLHLLTASNCTTLQINMKDIYGKYWQATYDDFRVADFANGFRLQVAGYHGNASDALDYQNKMEFSTVDNDRDISNTHCASNYEGGWWFSHCQHANLNGRYNLGLTWMDSSRNEWIAVATSEMRLRKRDVC